ncbi:MAG: zinc ribbon domain-containing protein [Xanthomonadaceae bacterium]|jgi:putative FmdB family regulatory protein|nr:zinc ribbon domain-containing protein [Xanthomonadaceae bacterium]
MPIYAFQCGQCGHSFDRLQKMSDHDPEVCPQCSAHAIKRQMTAPSFRLAGSGWYETDFKGSRDKRHNLASDSGGGSDGGGSSAGSGTSDNAPASGSSSSDKPAASST